MKKMSVYLALLIALIGLTSAKPIKIKEKEALIVGRIILDTDSEIDYKKIELRLQNGTKGSKKAKSDSDGFFYTKIGLNNSFVDYVQYKDGGTYQKILTEDCITLNIPEGGKIYYVGDVYLKWTPSDRDKLKSSFSLGIGFGGNHMGGGVAVPISKGHVPGEDCPQITIVDSEDLLSKFKEVFPDDTREIIPLFFDLP